MMYTEATIEAPAQSGKRQEDVLVLHTARDTNHPWRIIFADIPRSSSKLSTVDGGAPIRGDNGAHLKAVAPLVCARESELIREAFGDIGLSSLKLVPQSLSAFRINGSPASWVYRLMGYFGGDTYASVVLTISNVAEPKITAEHVAQQWRGLRFIRNNLPFASLSSSEGDKVSAPLRAYIPDEGIVKPLRLAVDPKEKKAAIAITEYKSGFAEINRFSNGYECNTLQNAPIAPHQNIIIGRAIAKLLTQIYAATYHPGTNLGVIPRGLSLNSGDIIIKLGSFNNPEVALCAANDCHYSPPEGLIDLITGGRDISFPNGDVHGRIIEPASKNLAVIFSALVEGLTPRFNNKAQELARKFLTAYATHHQAEVIKAFQALRGGKARSNFDTSYAASNVAFRSALFQRGKLFSVGKPTDAELRRIDTQLLKEMYPDALINEIRRTL